MTFFANQIAHVSRGFKQLFNCVSGATAVEYGLLAGLIAVGIAGGIGALADLVIGIFTMLGETSVEVSENIETG